MYPLRQVMLDVACGRADARRRSRRNVRPSLSMPIHTRHTIRLAMRLASQSPCWGSGS